jgi:peptide/nickel transport system substrate-binding protein
MKRAGIEFTVQPLDWSTFRSGVCERQEFAAAILVLSHSDVLVDPFDRYHSSEDRLGGENYCGLRDPRVDELLQQGRAEMDREKRAAIYHKLNRLLDELQPHTLIRHPLSSVVLSTRFRNAEVNARGLVADEWYVPLDKQLRNR